METKTTNIENYNQLSDAEKKRFRETYNKHPLFPYIDWDAYSKSYGGNTLDFVKCVDRYIDRTKNIMFFVLEMTIIDDMDYLLVYDCNENQFLHIPYDATTNQAPAEYVLDFFESEDESEEPEEAV